MYKTCHTEESSRRQRELENGLLAALASQPYEKLTITELCRALGVPRKTFYRYFPTKDDCLLALVDHALADCNEIALRGWDGSRELGADVQAGFFRYWYDRREFLDMVASNGLQYLLLDRTTAIVDRMKANGPSGAFARDQVEYFVAYGLMMVVLRWHHFGFLCPPEEMGEVFEKLLDNPEISFARLLL